jgi:hypothetical protein
MYDIQHFLLIPPIAPTTASKCIHHESAYFAQITMHRFKYTSVTWLCAGSGRLVSGQKYFACFERTGSIEGCSKRRTRSTLCYVGFFFAVIRTDMYKVIHILLVKPVDFQKSFCHFCNNHNKFYNLKPNPNPPNPNPNPEITLPT